MIGCQPQTTNPVWLKYFCKQIKNLYANISQDKHQFTAKKREIENQISACFHVELQEEKRWKYSFMEKKHNLCT